MQCLVDASLIGPLSAATLHDKYDLAGKKLRDLRRRRCIVV
jgi:hypothetical protein